MFEWLKSAFKSKEGNTRSSDSLLSTQQPTPSNGESTWVYIWNMTAQTGVGHAAVQVGGSKPKMKPGDPGEYISIHPDGIPSMGPTIVLPLPAHLATTLEEDMESQASSRPPIFSDFDPPTLPPNNAPSLVPPDRTLKIENLNTAAMLSHIDKTREGVNTGKTAYQLLPKVNVLGFLNDAPFFITQDPLDVHMNRRFFSRHNGIGKQAENCSTLVTDILNAGGADIEQSKMPWGITPNSLADQINNGPKF